MKFVKDFNRKNLLFSLCGLNCGLCSMNLGCHCPGCGGGEGNQSCAIARCSLQHDGVEYCFLCPEYPCDRYQRNPDLDSFITHQHQLEDMKRAGEIGIEAYTREQERKVEILQQLLAEYNDGKRKTFYGLAVNLLPLEDLERILKETTVTPDFQHGTQREQAGILAGEFQKTADEQGILLKLRKKRTTKEETEE